MPSKLRVLCEGLRRINRLFSWIAAGMILSPLPLYAHGDDDVTVASFIGPLLAFFVFVTVLGLGKVILRLIVRRV